MTTQTTINQPFSLAHWFTNAFSVVALVVSIGACALTYKATENVDAHIDNRLGILQHEIAVGSRVGFQNQTYEGRLSRVEAKTDMVMSAAFQKTTFEREMDAYVTRMTEEQEREHPLGKRK